MRRALWFSIALIVALSASVIVTSAVEAASNDEGSFASKINAERSSRGIPTLQWSENLAQIARRHSKEMADENDLHHNGNLQNEVSGWQVLGENVGYGPSVNDLHQAFMNSPEHRANILDTDYTLVGIGTVWRNGTLWVTEDFERPMSSRSYSHSTSRGSTTVSHPRPASTKTAPAAQHPAPAPAKRPITVPQPAAATGSTGEADLTRLMVANLLGRDDPAVGTIGEAEMLVAQQGGPTDLVALTFGPFARLVGRVNQGLLGRS